MINPKNISISAAIGFFLSFFIGLVSDVKFSHVLLRALIFAAIFAALCVAISFIYQKFLSTDSSSFVAEPDANLQRTAGGVVNIVVDDSNLTDDGLAPKFTVLNKRAHSAEKPSYSASAPVQSQAPVQSEKTVASEALPHEAVPLSQLVPESPLADSAPASSEAEAFTPVSLGASAHSSVPSEPASATVESSASATEESPDSAAVASSETAPASSESVPVSEGQLDDLPDIASMEAASGEETASDLDSVDEVVSDTDFSTGGAHLKEQPISGDTNVMAKAIQTLLAKDNS